MREAFCEGGSEGAMSSIKLGSKLDGFERKGRAWFVATELQSDIVVEVKDVKFYLHKFPLLSRSGLLNRLVFESRDTEKNRILLNDIPGGADTFELAAKFCYGMMVDLRASNVAPLWCAAVYLEMTETLETGNLISKAESFFNLVVLGSWKDSVAVLKSCEHLSPWAEKLFIVQRCSESIAWKACTDPRGSRSPISSGWNSRIGSPVRDENAGIAELLVTDWWFSDILNLPIHFFTKVVQAVTAKGMRAELVAAVVAVYALKWLPRKSDLSKQDGQELLGRMGNRLLDQLLGILPRCKDVLPTKVLVHFVSSAYLLDAKVSSKMDLEQRAGEQLESATVQDLLVPALCPSSCETRFDVDLVHRLVQYFFRKQSETASFYSGHSGKLAGRIRVANLIDRYLAEIARDDKLSVSRFMALAEAVPFGCRPSHDALYKAIDNFLKTHQELKDEDRKRLCQLMDCKKLSVQSCMHAAQNERLPLRTVMQVLFFEHLKLKTTSMKNDYEHQPLQSEDSATMHQEMQRIRWELEKLKAEFADFKSNFCSDSKDHFDKKNNLRSGSSDYLHNSHKSLHTRDLWKKLGKSLQNLSSVTGVPESSSSPRKHTEFKSKRLF